MLFQGRREPGQDKMRRNWIDETRGFQNTSATNSNIESYSSVLQRLTPSATQTLKEKATQAYFNDQLLHKQPETRTPSLITASDPTLQTDRDEQEDCQIGRQKTMLLILNNLRNVIVELHQLYSVGFKQRGD